MVVKVAPRVYLQSWDEVADGYIHGCGHFIIDTKEGNCIHVSEPAEIEQTLAIWDSQVLSDADPRSPLQRAIDDQFGKWDMQQAVQYEAVKRMIERPLKLRDEFNTSDSDHGITQWIAAGRELATGKSIDWK
jgi:hypothetical protein